jgi:diguanylate cyclase (GGDEF)-like protein
MVRRSPARPHRWFLWVKTVNMIYAAVGAAVAALVIGVPAVALSAWIRELLRYRTRAVHLDTLLAEQLHRVEHHSHRLETLWKLASQAPLEDDAFLRAVLTESSAAIHAGPEFYGVISHLEGAEVVIDLNQRGDAIDGALAGGARLPLADTLVSELARAHTTCSWADVRADERLAAIPRVHTMPWRAFIGTRFRIGTTLYFLTFTSESALVEPFTADDHAYLEIVASMYASRLEQRVQFERLCHEASHDALTGLSNRTAFRVAGMQALASGETLALAVVDIDGFRALNEAVGHQTADAVLVEVGAAIGARIAERDVVARIGGDTFGVLLRDAENQRDVERRVERIRSAFCTPFGTGDRDGKRRIAVTASVGVAVASGGGPSFERLLAQADAAVQAAKQRGPACLAV